MSDKDIAGLSDAEFLNKFAEHEAEIAAAPPKSEASKPGVQAEAQPSGTESEGKTEPDVTGGADSAEQVPEGEGTGEGKTSEEGKEEDGNGEPSEGTTQAKTDSDQESDTGKGTPPDESESTSSPETGAELAQLMAPLKAAKRTIKLESVEQARQLMQMGVDYSRKMQDMKPYQRVLKSLERADLLDEGKLNFLIDLANKRPEAIKKLLKDSEIDPLDLDLENNEAYKPNDHMIPDGELALDAVLDEIRPSPHFEKTVNVITGWDTASKRSLMDNPDVLRHIAAHLETGIYDMIMDRLESERIFGKHAGLSDLDAYKAVGDAMHNEGAFAKANPKRATSTAGNTDQGHSQDSQGSSEAMKARKRAASPPKGTAGKATKPLPDFGKMTDAEIENFDWRSAL